MIATAFSHGCLAPAHGKRAQYSTSTRLGREGASKPGNGGSSLGGGTNQPKVLTASAAELSGHNSFPLSTSLLPAASRSSTCRAGNCGSDIRSLPKRRKSTTKRLTR